MSKSPSLTLSRATIAEAREAGIEDHLALHWEEVEIEHARNPLAINWPAYRDLERQGVLRVYLLRRDARLIGYSVWFVQPPLHHSLTKWAVCDLLYVVPEERGRAGIKLVRDVERLLTDEGVKAINYNVKPANLDSRKPSGRVGLLLAKLGYRLVEEAWAKYI